MSLLSLSQFVSKYDGKTVGYPEGSYVGECLSLVKWYIKECFGITPPASGCNGARCYWLKFPSPLDTVFKKVPNTPDLIPERGWIAVWDENTGAGYGHIGIVLEGATTAHFDSFDQNWGGRQAHTVRHDYKHVYGFLAPKETMPELMQIERKDYERLMKASRLGDQLIKYLGLEGNIADKSEAQIWELKEKVQRAIDGEKRLTLELEKCQSQAPSKKLAETITVAGAEWHLNGIQVTPQGIEGNYARIK